MKLLQLVICFLSISACKSPTISIVALPALTEIDSIKHNESISTYRTDYFLVKGNSKKINDSIRRYLSNNLDSGLLKFNQYDMIFYKKSNALNLETLNKYSQKYKAFEDEKPIVTYTWFNGKLAIH